MLNLFACGAFYALALVAGGYCAKNISYHAKKGPL